MLYYLSYYSVSVIIGASFPILPRHGWAKCLGVLYTTTAFLLPCSYQPTLVISTTVASWMRLETLMPETQPSQTVSQGPAGPLGQCHKPQLLSSLSTVLIHPPTVYCPLGHLTPQHSLLSPHCWDPQHFLFKKLGMLRKREEEALTSSSFCFLGLQKPLRQKILGV